jgi:hypothetical protein
MNIEEIIIYENMQKENKQLKEKASKLEKCLLEIKEIDNPVAIYYKIEDLFRELYLD